MSKYLIEGDSNKKSEPVIVPTAPALALTTPKDKAEIKQNPVQYYVKASFMITYILLLTTGTITFIEALRTPVPELRHIFNLETCISAVAGYFYSTFTSQIEEFGKKDLPIDWADITKTRYIDWAITTPLMLLVLSVVLGMCIGKKVQFKTMAVVILLNYFMLYTGYLGEARAIGRELAFIVAFIPFFAMFYLIYISYVAPKYCFQNYVLFSVFITLWGFYGIAYMFEESYKNIAMNVLDCLAKCFVGLGLWVYYSQIIVA